MSFVLWLANNFPAASIFLICVVIYFIVSYVIEKFSYTTCKRSLCKHFSYDSFGKPMCNFTYLYSQDKVSIKVKYDECKYKIKDTK
jgi:hypothetical protein